MKSSLTHLNTTMYPINKLAIGSPITSTKHAVDLQSYVDSIVGLQAMGRHIETTAFKKHLTKETLRLANLAIESINKSKTHATIVACEDNNILSIDNSKTQELVVDAVSGLKDKAINVIIDLIGITYQDIDNYDNLIKVVETNKDKLIDVLTNVAIRELPIFTTVKPQDYFIDLFCDGKLDTSRSLETIKYLSCNLLDPIDATMIKIVDFIYSKASANSFSLNTKDLPQLVTEELPGMLKYNTQTNSSVGLLFGLDALDYLNDYKHTFTDLPDKIKYIIEIGRQTRLSILYYVKDLKTPSNGVNINTDVLDRESKNKDSIRLLINQLTDASRDLFTNRSNKDNGLFRSDKFSSVCDFILDLLKQEEQISYEDQFLVDLFTSSIRLHSHTKATVLAYCIMLLNSLYNYTCDNLTMYSFSE